MYGCTFTGKSDYSSNSVFLPAAGHYDGSESSYVGGSNGRGYYWSNTLYTSNDYQAYSLYFNKSTSKLSEDNPERYRGFTIRPVLSE